MRLYLGGHLDWYAPQRQASHEIRLGKSTCLLTVLRGLGIPPSEIATTAVNGALVDLDCAEVSDGDTVELFAAIGGG